MKKGLKITLIIIGALLLLIFIATLLISPIAKSYVNNHGEELVGRKIHVDDLKVNLYSGHVGINGLSLYEDNGSDKFATFDTLDVKVRLFNLIKHEVYVKHVSLSGLDVNLLQNGKRFNFTSIIEHFPKDTTKVEDTTPSDWIINLHNIALRDGHIYYADQQRSSHWDLKNLNIIVPDFCIGGTQASDADLSLALADGGTLNANADYNTNSNDFAVTLDLEQFAMQQVKPYLVDMMNLGQLDGRINANVNVVGNLDNIMDMVVKGSVDINNVDVEDDNGRSLLKTNHIAVVVNKIVLSNNLYDIASLSIEGLTSRYDTYADGKNNFSHLMKPKSAKPSEVDSSFEVQTSSPKKQSPMNLTVGKVDCKDLTFTYADHTLPEPFDFTLTNISIQSDNLKLQGENSAKIFAALPHGGHAAIRWTGNITQWKESQHLNLAIKNLHLTDLSPYLLAYLGQPFTEGTFSFTSTNHITHSNLNGQNHLDIFKASVGDRRKDIDAKMRLPLKAALFILKDKDDKILFDVPISGNIDSPEFNYMKLVWKTLGNLIVKVATSPFKALGNALGFDSDKLQYIPIDPSQHDFTSEQYYQLEQIADLINKTPDLRFILEQQLLPDTEEQFLQFAPKRNEILMRHMEQLGVPKDRIIVRNAPDTLTPLRNGYSVTTQLIDPIDTTTQP